MRANRHIAILVFFLQQLNAPGAFSQKMPGAKLEELRCEYAVNPIGIGEESPRLSWVINAATRNWKQSAYRILVASSRGLLEKDKGDLWDSERVLSGQSNQVAYEGSKLSSHKICYWKVMVWDQNSGAIPWSDPAIWEMGLMSEKDWKAKWIGRHNNELKKVAIDTVRKEKPRPPSEPAPYLRKQFVLKNNVKRARLYMSAPGWAQLHLNQDRVGGNRERDPGFTRFDKTLLYATYDVTNLVHKGNNVMGAVLGTGWYDTHDLAVWFLEKAPWRGRPRIKLQLFVEYTNGSSERIVSDESWKVTTGPVLSDGIYTGEVYDANKELTGWMGNAYTDTSWKTCVIMPEPGGRLMASSSPPVGISRTIRPVAISEPKPGVYIVDMGENFSGHALVHMKAPKDTKLVMRYAETLDKGMIERNNIESFMAITEPRQLFQTDIYIFKGEGMETWEGQFTYHGFRYIEVTGLPFKPTPDDFSGRFTHTLLEQTSSFKSSSQLLNDIQKIVLQSYLSNAQDIPTDCPQREKNGWSADAHLAAETGMMNYNAAGFYNKWLNDNADAQLKNGLLPVIIPSADWGLHWDPEWNTAYHMIAWDLYRFYNDKRVLEKHYDNLRLYVDSLATKRKEGLLPGFYYGDWAFYLTQTSKKLTSNAYLFQAVQILAKSAVLLDKTTDAGKYSAMSDTIRQAFNNLFFKDMIYDKGSQSALAVPLNFGMVPPGSESGVLGNLIYNLDTTGHIDAGILGTRNLLRTLSENGRTDIAYKLINTRSHPGWGYWLSQGATSLWGGWGRKGKRNSGSLNHIMFGDISAWMYEYLAGIKPDEKHPGFRHFFVAPFIPDDLSYLDAVYLSASGKITVSWKKQKEQLDLRIVIPANTSATITLPVTDIALVQEGGKPLYELQEFKKQQDQRGQVFFTAGSGDYRFVINKK